MLAPASARADALVTNCELFGPGLGTLEDALAVGGHVTFECSGEIVFPRPIVVTKHTTIDGTGESIVLRGSLPPLGDSLVLPGSVPPPVVDVILQAGLEPNLAPHLRLHRISVSHAAVQVVKGRLTLTEVTISHSPREAVLNLASRASITNSTLSNNAVGIRTEMGRTKVVNTTISGNRRWGIGQANGSLVLINSTLSGNPLRNAAGSLQFSNTIFHNAACVSLGDVLGRIVDNGHNIESANTCGLTHLSSRMNTNPMLGPLGDHGGPTATHALLVNSPAIDMGDDIVCTGSDVAGVDQRGVVRPWRGAACDIGAFEFVSLANMGDHFRCFEAEGDDLDVRLTLADQFGDSLAKVDDPRLLCNPVDTNQGGIVDRTAHLVCYDIDEDDDAEDGDLDWDDTEWEVLVENHLGMQMLEVEDSELLCVPSERDGVRSRLMLEHFKCYEAEGDELDVRVDLVDQFGDVPNVRVEEPELFCNPVSTTGGTIYDDNAHLVCYEIDDAGIEVSVRNEFGAQILEVDEAKLLCVPSAKLSVKVVPDDDDDGYDYTRCGLGFELALLMSACVWLHGRRRQI
jgi:hypothetical protein